MNAVDPNEIPLRDIHLPEAVGAWPPAPGWWLLLLIAMAVLIGVVVFIRRRRRYRVQREAAMQLRLIEREYERTNDANAALRAVSSLLRRVAISLQPGAAAVTGDQWVTTLADLGHMLVPESLRRTLFVVPYQRPQDPLPTVEDITRVFQFVDSWITGTQKKAQTGV